MEGGEGGPGKWGKAQISGSVPNELSGEITFNTNFSRETFKYLQNTWEKTCNFKRTGE